MSMKYIMRCTSVLMFSCYTNWYIYLHDYMSLIFYDKLVGKYTISFVNIDAMGLVLLNFPLQTTQVGANVRNISFVGKAGQMLNQLSRCGVGLSTMYDDGLSINIQTVGMGMGFLVAINCSFFGGLKLDWSTEQKAGIHSGSYIHITYIWELKLFQFPIYQVTRLDMTRPLVSNI